jgi:hypothetical protein
VGSVFGPIRFLLLFADFVDFYTHWAYILYMPIFRRIFLSNYWWQKSDIWSQASYRYHISWEAFFDPSDSYFLFAKERGYHRWALAHSSSCYTWWNQITWLWWSLHMPLSKLWQHYPPSKMAIFCKSIFSLIDNYKFNFSQNDLTFILKLQDNG